MPTPGVHVVIAPLDRGVVLPGIQLAIVAEADLTGRRRVHRRPRGARRGVDYYEGLAKGDFVVHRVHGVGRYLGMETQEMFGITRDRLVVEFKGSDRVYVDSEDIGLIRKYTGGETPKLSKMGGADWEKTRAGVRRAVRDIAGELVVLYRRRLATPGHAFAPDTPFQHQIEESFPYEETPDQAQAIVDTKADMERPIPMDRLVCGDVGYGKTEVALRAAAKAVFDGKQVAILVPTTLLASQHGQTFRERFANYPVRVEVLSRFLSAKEQTEVVRGVQDGTVDIVIGTHRLLSDDMQFKDLGLLVVDEEQRFGVQHKERIKGMRTSVDILTLTATPIPRTLEMSLTGIRDLSLVNTPPEDRQPILTYVGEHDPRAVSEAIRRELLREGQVLYVHNRVKDIEHVAADVRELVPEARVAVAHGQMDESRLERVVQEFWEHELDVLVCTTIVESGLDMPTVNTLVVDRADRLGLAQLYQLRGRVGRRGQRAYAYLLYPSDHKLSEEAYERLKTIGEFTDLGSGFKIAMRDLEIRGAGSLLGAEQSGHIAAVGFDLYVEMVTEAVDELTGRAARRSAEDVQIDLPGHRAPPARLHRARRRAHGGVPAARRGHDRRRRRRCAGRMDRPLRTAARAGRGAARRRAPARRVPAPRHPRGLRAEGPGPIRRLGAAKVAGSAACSGCRPRSRSCRDVVIVPVAATAECRFRRRFSGCSREIAPAERPRYDPPDETSLCALRRGRRRRAVGRMRRASSTLSDAATISYTQKGKSQHAARHAAPTC